jgi:hypothetical protein
MCVTLLETKMCGRRGEHVNGFAGRETLQFRHIVLDDEKAAVVQVRGGVAKTFGLFVLGGQVRDRVAQQVDQRERPARGGGREIADVTPISEAPSCAWSCETIARDSSIPCTRTPRRLSGNAMRPVPMRSSSAGPVPASSARKLTAGSTTSASNSSGQNFSYRWAIHSGPYASREVSRDHALAQLVLDDPVYERAVIPGPGRRSAAAPAAQLMTPKAMSSENTTAGTTTQLM